MNKRLIIAKMPIYYVGGYVRDLLMTGKKSKDVDLLFIGSFDDMFNHTKEQGMEIYKIDTITNTIRCRHPELGPVDFQSADSSKRNLLSRDFSINSLAIPYGGGVESAISPYGPATAKEIISIKHIGINEECFANDPARIFRLLRFCAEYDKSVVFRDDERVQIVNMFKCNDEDELNRRIEKSIQYFNRAVEEMGWMNIVLNWDKWFGFNLLKIMADAGIKLHAGR